MDRAVRFGAMHHALAAGVGAVALRMYGDMGCLIAIVFVGAMWGFLSSLVAYLIGASRPWVTTCWIGCSAILTLFVVYLGAYAFLLSGADC